MSLRFSRGDSMVHLLELVAMDAPLRSLAASIFAGLSETALPDGLSARAFEVKQELRLYMNSNASRADCPWPMPPAHTRDVPYRVPPSEGLNAFLRRWESVNMLAESSTHGTLDSGNLSDGSNSLETSTRADETYFHDHATTVKLEDRETSAPARGIGLEEILHLLSQSPNRREHSSGTNLTLG